jgi:hypothetical protein
MGVSNEMYLIHGIRLDPKKINEAYDELSRLFFPYRGILATGTMGILCAVMDSSYCFAGKCIAVNSDESEFNFLTVPRITPSMSSELTDWLERDNVIKYKTLPLTEEIFLINHYH